MKQAKRQVGIRRRIGQRGIALISALFALMLLSAIAAGMVFMANTETAINYNFRDAEYASYAAKAGIEEVRMRMVDNAANPLCLFALGTTPPAGCSATPLITDLPTTTSGLVYMLNPAGASDTVAPASGTNQYFDTEFCHDNYQGIPANGSITPGVPCSTAQGPPLAAITAVNSVLPDANTTGALAFKWVRIAYKANNTTGYSVDGTGNPNPPVCWDSYSKAERTLPADRATCDSDPGPGATLPPTRQVYILTSLAVTPRGTRRMVQAEVAFDAAMNLNSAVESNDNVVLNGALTVAGYDNCSCDCTVTGSGSSKTMNCTARLGHPNGCVNNKYGIYASGSIQNPTGASEQIYAGTTPPYVGSNTTPPSSGFPFSSVSNLISTLSTQAGVVNVTGAPYNWSCTGNPPDCGTQSGASLGTATFPLNPPDNPAGMSQQLTYVPGSVHLSGAATGSGILMVNGDLTINGGLQFYGLIIVSGSVRFQGGGSAPTNIYGGVLSGTPLVDNTTLGGSANIQYDYCALKWASKHQAPRLISMRELSY